MGVSCTLCTNYVCTYTLYAYQMCECIFLPYTFRTTRCDGNMIRLTNNIQSLIIPRAQADGFPINLNTCTTPSHICTYHYSKYYTNWKGQGCIDPQCHQPLLCDKHTLTIVPNRCLTVFFNPLPSSLIHNTCLKLFDKRYHTHPNYIPPSPRKRKALLDITNINNNQIINNDNHSHASSIHVLVHGQDQDKENKVSNTIIYVYLCTLT